MKYIIPVTLNHIVGFTNFCSKSDNPNLEYDNSFHTVPVDDKPYRVVINTGLTIYNTGDS